VNGRLAWLVAGASGTALWVVASLVEGRREAWDASAYWTTYLPLAGLLSLVLGAFFRERPWRWGLAVILAQLPVMLFFTGEIGSLVVGGLFVLLIEAVPAMVAALLGGWIGGRVAGSQ